MIHPWQCKECRHNQHEPGQCTKKCSCGESEIVLSSGTSHSMGEGRFEFSGRADEQVVHTGYRTAARYPEY